MRPDRIIDIMNVTALIIAALMVALVILPAERDIVGNKRSWCLFMMLCVMLAARAVIDFLGPVWEQASRMLLEIGAGILFPWVLWEIYRDTRLKARQEETVQP
ncbi:MAG: hypothetical protein HY204_01180 [Nitrospirae bacterium]|nr:hypothetical protein [Nitrospirota bacterium]